MQEALAALKELASEQGFLQPDGGIACPENQAILITAAA